MMLSMREDASAAGPGKIPTGRPDAAVVPRTLEGVLAELRRLAVVALDAGHPLAAAQIATTADRVEANAWPSLPARPSYLSAAPRR
jgi:hypothetical protein